MRVGWFLGLVLAFVVAAAALAPAAAQAREEPTPHAGAAASHEGHAPAQERNIFEYALDLTVWTIVVFLVLLWVLRRFAWGPMLEGLQRREHNIRSALEEAQRAREEAERVRGQLQAEMDRAADTVREMMDRARKDAQRSADELVARARGEIQTERDRLRREIDTARDQALQEIWRQAADLATHISSKAIRRQLSADDHRRLVDEALAELSQAGNSRRKVY